MTRIEFKLIKNNKPKLDKIKFSCDEKICEKLDQYEMVRDNLNFYKPV